MRSAPISTAQLLNPAYPEVYGPRRDAVARGGTAVGRSGRLPVVGIVAGFALAAAACTSGGTEQSTSQSPAARQVLTVAAGADGYYENPKYPTIGRYPTNAGIFEPLVRITPDYQLAPALA